MRLRTRLGTSALACIFAVSAMGAVQPDNETTTEPSPTESTSPAAETDAPVEPTPSETTTPPGEETDPPEEPSDVPPPQPPPPPEDFSCKIHLDEESSVATITWPQDQQFSDVEVMIDGEQTSPDNAEDGQMQLDFAQEHESIHVRFLDGDGQELAECSRNIPTVAPSPTPTPTPTPTPEPSSPAPSPSDEEPTGGGEPSSPGTGTTPTDTPAPGPGQITPPATTPPPAAPAPTTQAPVVPAPTPEPDLEEATPLPPSTPSSQPRTDEPQGPVERNIRQYADSPRHLLSQLRDGQSHAGAGLIRPQPHDLSNDRNTLETLPPVSDNELDAIKARVATPEKGDGLDEDDTLSSDADERLASFSSPWLLAVIVTVVLVGLGIWWAITRRKPRH